MISQGYFFTLVLRIVISWQIIRGVAILKSLLKIAIICLMSITELTVINLVSRVHHRVIVSKITVLY
jgi:hypothetical protein